jgi:hypothetical protein
MKGYRWLGLAAIAFAVLAGLISKDELPKGVA